MKLIFIILGGGAGALLRYLLSGFVQKYSNSGFPLGTLIVNLSGCFLIGLIWEFSETFLISPNIRLLVFMGFIGAFTTFSTYSFETVNLLRDGQIKFALLNVLLNNISGILFVFAGIMLSKFIIKLILK